MADVQVLAGGTKAAPLAYTIPGAQEIVLKSLFATFDGTAAGGSFLPCIRIVAPSGKVVGEYTTDASVAAGSSAEVSFAPFLRGAASGGGGVSVYSDGVLVATEPGIDFEDNIAVSWRVIDHAGLGYVSVQPSGPYYSVAAGTNAAFTLASAVAAEIGFTNAITGGGLVTTHAVGGLTGFGTNDTWPAFCQATVTWPAGNYSRYLEIAVDTPISHGVAGNFPTPMRFAAATTPEGDQMTAFAFAVAAAGGSPIRLNGWQNSGLNKVVVVNFVVYASLMVEV